MSKVIVMNGLSLDGVMQAPGRPDEDRRGGFEHGGWGAPYGDESMVATWGQRLAALTGVATSGCSGAGPMSSF